MQCNRHHLPGFIGQNPKISTHSSYLFLFLPSKRREKTKFLSIMIGKRMLTWTKCTVQPVTLSPLCRTCWWAFLPLTDRKSDGEAFKIFPGHQCEKTKKEKRINWNWISMKKNSEMWSSVPNQHWTLLRSLNGQNFTGQVQIWVKKQNIYKTVLQSLRKSEEPLLWSKEMLLFQEHRGQCAGFGSSQASMFQSRPRT